MQNDFFNRLLLIKSELENISDRKFATRLGTTPEKYRTYMAGSVPSITVVGSILLNFPEINPDWLINGIGEMHRKKENDEVVDEVKDTTQEDLVYFLKEENLRMQEKCESLVEERGRLRQHIEDLESQLSVFLPKANAAEKVIKYKGKHT